MSYTPIRKLTIDDFRCLDGTTEFSFDAPIVLLHGTNGAGKTSILSAMELAMTGKIASMQRFNKDYFKYLPTQGMPSATVEVELLGEDGNFLHSGPMTINEGGLTGKPALTPAESVFYSERCYLDQSSLARLLELYEHREGSGESALVKFATEILGLEQLDATINGLEASGNIRRIKKVTTKYTEAEKESADFAELQQKLTEKLASAKSEQNRLFEKLNAALAGLSNEFAEVNSEDDMAEVASFLSKQQVGETIAETNELSDLLDKFGRQVKDLSLNPASDRLEVAKTARESANQKYTTWQEEHERPIEILRLEIRDAGFELEDEGIILLKREVAKLELQLQQHLSAVEETRQKGKKVAALRATLDTLQLQIAETENQSGSLAIALAAMREHVLEEVCPVCERDYSEISDNTLEKQLSQRIQQLTDQGTALQQLVKEREAVVKKLDVARRELEDAQARIFAESILAETKGRRDHLESLGQRFEDLSEAFRDGTKLNRDLQMAERELEDLGAAKREEVSLRSRLIEVATRLSVSGPYQNESIQASWKRLVQVAKSKLSRLTEEEAANDNLDRILQEIDQQTKIVNELTTKETEASKNQRIWENRFNEIKRRVRVAKSIRDTAISVKGDTIRRVFGNSLNQVWSDVFSRLAPQEAFVPAFQVSKPKRAGLKLELETVYSERCKSGHPSLMLSSGNLNTAALSLFIALHLAVKPQMPCLVLDAPVQSMDDTHVAQFACLMRVLSRHHERQIIIAVHERPMFEYLKFELSPAFEGDELITIELDRPSESKSRPKITRIPWKADPWTPIFAEAA